MTAAWGGEERETECKQLSLPPSFPLSPFHVAIHNTKLAGSLSLIAASSSFGVPVNGHVRRLSS